MSNVEIGRNKSSILKDTYNKHRLRKRLFVIILIPVVLLLVGSAIAFCSADIKFLEVYTAVLRKKFPGLSSAADSGHTDIIIWKLRQPRILMEVLVGIVLVPLV